MAASTCGARSDAAQLIGAARRVSPTKVASAVVASLSPELLKPEWRARAKRSGDPATGHCAVASEAFYWLMGGAPAGYKAMHVSHEGASHWWVEGPGGELFDLTVSQFGTPVPYERCLRAYERGEACSRGVGFRSRRIEGTAYQCPSERAAEVMRRAARKLAVRGGPVVRSR